MSLLKKIFNKSQKDEKNIGIGSGNHNNRYELTEEDRIKAEEVKRINREIKKRKALRDAYKEKLLDDLEIKQIQNDILEVGKEDGEDDVDNVMMKTLMGLMGGNPLDPQTIVGNNTTYNANNEDFYADEIVQSANEGIIQQEALELPESRFNDEQVKNHIDKVLNKDQMKFIQNLNESEILQIHQIVKQKNL